MFKNRWYTEGTARWSESMFSSSIGEHKPLPQSITELNTILAQTYKTSLMWNRLIYLVDENNCRQYTLGDSHICGTNFMKSFLENLGKYAEIRSKEMHFQPYHWKESDQKSSENNPYILKALRDSIIASQTQNEEIKEFLNLLTKY